MNFSYIDTEKNMPIPPPSINAGLYASSSEIQSFSKKPWGNDYAFPPVPPDSAAYASHFYAKHHIPSAQNRLGNSELLPNDVISKYADANYNINCYN